MTELPLFGIKTLLAPALAAGQAAFLLCYLPFGIVRGQIVAPEASPEAADADNTNTSSPEDSLMIELRDAVVEHYSNHLPTGRYPRLHLRLSDISGCVLLDD